MINPFKHLCVALALFVLTVNSPSMDFSWGSYDSPQKTEGDTDDAIWMTGEIKQGDYEKFRLFILRNNDKYALVLPAVRLSSSGGNVIEALRMAALLRAMYAKVHVGYDQKCTSSCFLLFIAGVSRIASSLPPKYERTNLGIHRPYFEPQYFAGLSGKDAEAKQASLSNLVSSYLRNNSVPVSIIEKMMSTPSKDVYWLSNEEDHSLGDSPPWYEELMISRCKKIVLTKNARGNEWLDEFDRYLADVDRFTKCEDQFIRSELKQNLLVFLKQPDPLKID